MPVFAAPLVAPAVAEGLGWTLGGLAALWTGKSIAENKDDIMRGISDFGDWATNKVSSGIGSLSRAMSPRTSTPNPNVDQKTGRYIASSDATRVAPLVVLDTPRIEPRAYPKLSSYFYPTEAQVPNDSTRAASAPADTARTVAPGTPASRSAGNSTSTSTSSGTASSSPANPNNGKGFKDRLKQVLNRIKQGYGNALIGLEYGLGFGVPVAGLGYGIYKWVQPEKTKGDSILDSLLYLVGELNKAVLINENLKKINALLQQILNGSQLAQPTTPSDTVQGRALSNNADFLSFDTELEALRNAYGGN